MKQVIVLPAGRVSTDWRAKRPFRALTSQLFTVAAAALLLVGGGSKPVYADYIVTTLAQTDINNSIIGYGNYNSGQQGSSFNMAGGGTATGTVDSTGKLTASFDRTTVSYMGESGSAGAMADLSNGALGAYQITPFGSK